MARETHSRLSREEEAMAYAAIGVLITAIGLVVAATLA